MKLIGLEEHLVINDVLDAWRALESQWQDLALAPSMQGDSARRLADLGEKRLADMEKSGIDVQVLSLSTTGGQNLASAEAVALQVAANDVLADAVRNQPDYFQGLATLATPDLTCIGGVPR